MAWIALAARADPVWLQQHLYQPGHYLPPGDSGAWEIRTFAFLTGSLFLFIALRVQSWGAVLRGALAAGLAVAVVEVAVRIGFSKPPARHPHLEHRIGRDDPRLGWLWTPSQTTEEQINGQPVRYAIDARSDRARTQEFVEDPDAPTVMIAGESIAFGHGLNWDDSLAGVLQRELHVQVIDVAVSGYGTHQAALRLADAAPRFRHLLATVTLFLPVQLGRNVTDLRRRSPLRLFDMLAAQFPFLGDARLEESLRIARSDLERAGLVVLADFTEKPGDAAWLDDRLLHGLRVVRVRIPRESLTSDWHPSAAATVEFARPIVAELRRGWQK